MCLVCEHFALEKNGVHAWEVPLGCMLGGGMQHYKKRAMIYFLVTCGKVYALPCVCLVALRPKQRLGSGGIAQA